MATQSDDRPSSLQGKNKRSLTVLLVTTILFAVSTAVLAGLLMNIYQRKQEAKNPYLRFVNVTEDTTDPAEWGKNWPREYDGYQRTVNSTRTRYGGGSASEAEPPPEKAVLSPWLTRMFAGYAFAIDYRDRRGHAFMLTDQEQTKRTTQAKQPGSCLHCHASIMPLYRKTGAELAPGAPVPEQVQKGFAAIGKLDYWQANEKLKQSGHHHPVSCVDCHDPKTMQLRVTRPGFINGIKALKAHEGNPNYDPNRDATRQEMRSFVCGQCHVEYYCGPKTTLFYPWNNGIKVEEIESYYDSYKFEDGHRFYDWKHADTGAEVLKAQHPEFEVWSQGTHGKAGVACADCHMPYMREGALKVSDHWVRSPLLNLNRACQQCHHYPEDDIKKRVYTIQDRHFALLQRTGTAIVDMIDAIKLAKAAGANEDQLHPVLELQRKAQWRMDFVAAENSMGFHASQELARILGEAIDLARQAQLSAVALKPGTAAAMKEANAENAATSASAATAANSAAQPRAAGAGRASAPAPESSVPPVPKAAPSARAATPESAKP